MKKSLILALFFVPLMVFGQDYRHQADSLFQHLDKSTAATGILYDRVYPLAGLQQFNKIHPDTSAAKHFKQAYFEMYNAAFDNTNWVNLEGLTDVALSVSLNNKVPVGVASYQFNLIDTNSVADNLIQVGTDSLFYDINPRSRSPFQTIDNLVASPLIDSIPGLYVSYDFDSRLFINKSSLSISTLQVDFNDGAGLVNVSIGNTYNVSYGSSGYKTLKFVATMSNSTVITSYGVIRVGEPPADVFLRGGCNYIGPQIALESDLTFQGYTESAPSKGQGQYKIFYATDGACDGVLRKPVIVIDGFDPGDSRNIDQLYNDNLNTANTGHFADNLRANGYDVVMLNFPNYQIGTINVGSFGIYPIMRDGGADYIERNARVLIKLINTINSQKQGNEKLIIIGPSMGGLISRYALKYMENNNMPHNTKLWISFDSPHKGANIPIGDQHFINFYASISGDAKKNRDEKISSVAAKQMLINHYLAGSTTITGAPGFRDTFSAMMDNLGFPQGDPGQPFRKISIFDGNLSGARSYYGSQKAFSSDVRQTFAINLFLFKIKLATVTLSSAKVYFTPDYGSTSMIFNGWFVSSLLERIRMNSTPSTTTGLDTSPGGTFNTQQILQEEGEGIVGLYSSHTILGKVVNAITGGFFNTQVKFYSLIPSHSFINTKSALAFTGSNQNLGENIADRSLVCTGETPFDSYYGDFTVNRPHVDLWPEAVDYIQKEISGNPQLPTIKSNLSISGPFQSGGNTTYSIANMPSGATVKWEVSSPYAINGSDTANPVGIVIPANNYRFIELIATVSTNCYKTIVRRTLVPPSVTTSLVNSDICGEGTAEINVPPGIEFTWTPYGDISIEGQPVGQPYTTTNNSVNLVGIQGTLVVTFKSYGNTVTTYKDYAPYMRPVHISANPMIGSDPLVAMIQNIDYSYNSIKWYLDGFLINSDGESFYDSGNPPCGTHTLHAEASLPCGQTLKIAETSVERYCSGTWSVVMYPNPASNSLNVTYSETTAETQTASRKSPGQTESSAKNAILFEIRLFNDQGKMVRSLFNQNGTTALALNTSDLPNGAYFLHILKGKETIKKQVIIQH